MCEVKNARQDGGYEVSMSWGTEVVLSSVAFGTNAGNSVQAFPTPQTRPDINSV